MQVFLCSTHNVPWESVARLLEKLPPERAALCQKSPAKAAARAIGFFLVCHAVKQLAPDVDPWHWVLEEGGKPHLQDTPVHFSLSYAEDIVAVAVSRNRPIGLDIEQIHPRKEGFAARWFSPAEQAEIATAKDPDAALITLWTKKEAAAKQSGEGLGFALSRIDVTHAASSFFVANGKRYALSLSPAESIPAPTWVGFGDLTP